MALFELLNRFLSFDNNGKQYTSDNHAYTNGIYIPMGNSEQLAEDDPYLTVAPCLA